MEFDEVIEIRHSTRAFKDKKIEPERLKKILKTVASAPSAGNLKAYKISIILNSEIKRKLAEAALNQDFIFQAPVVLVFSADLPKSAAKYGKRGAELYSFQDATIAAIFAWLKAVDLGLSGCWVGAFNGELAREILELPNNLRPIAILPIGYS